ncbi:MAG: sulfatase-like hydrolase/transferase [Bryobacterales bacterium]|nr:sulfatase-like hydrolase/transferase [Bryobacterales bacterium]
MRTTRRQFTAAALGGLLSAQAQDRRPNFVILYTDDQGIGDLGCYGASDARTPHLDQLAQSGVRFTDWYSNSPVCSPSRASLMTGKYPHRAGVPDVLLSRAAFDVPGLRAGERTLARDLQAAGYRTGIIGKWHLGSAAHSRPKAQGFDHFFGFYSGWTDYYSHRYYTLGRGQSEILHDLWRNDEEVWEEPAYQTEVITREALRFIRDRARQPFLLYVAYGAPHYPMQAPKQYLDRFPASMDRDRRTHLAMIAAIDDSVGAIRAELKKRGIDRETVIFFQSDNGATEETRADHAGRPYRGGSNAPFRGFKMGLFEGGIRMPAMLSWPGRIPAAQVISEPGAAMDILPTFRAMAGLKEPAPGIDGKDVSAMVMSRARSPHEAIYWKYARQRAVRRGDWKLLLDPPSFSDSKVMDKVWLSNLREDPGERRNYAPEQPGLVRELTALLEAWEATLAGGA